MCGVGIGIEGVSIIYTIKSNDMAEKQVAPINQLPMINSSVGATDVYLVGYIRKDDGTLEAVQISVSQLAALLGR